MKPNLTIILVLGILFSACQSSLQITKRKYRPGYYVHFNEGKLKTHKFRVEKKEDADTIFSADPTPIRATAEPEIKKAQEDFPVTAGLQSIAHKRKVRYEVSAAPARINLASASDTTKNRIGLPEKSQKDKLKFHMASIAILMFFISSGLSFIIFFDMFFPLLIAGLIIDVIVIAFVIFLFLAVFFSLVSIFIKADQPSKSLFAKILAWSALSLSVGIFLFDAIFVIFLMLLFSSGLS